MPESDESKKATRRRNAIEITLVVLGILAFAALFFFMLLTDALKDLH